MKHYLKQDDNFGTIVDFDLIRENIRETYDALHPEFNMLASLRTGITQYDDDPNPMIAQGASMLAWMMLLAAEEHELAEELKDSIFTLGWTEEHAGSDLLSLQTEATLLDEPTEEGYDYYLKGNKWLINNSYHADYHMVVAKMDAEQDGPRSLSLFLVPHSSTKNWERLNTAVLDKMVLTKYDIDGPGRLVGKRGHGLSIIQRMAQPSKYQCAFMGIRLMKQALDETLDHLSTKTIFKTQPIKFSNVYRQLYNLVLDGAFYDFVFQRAVAYSDTKWLSFHGTMLKSWLLLRVNELLSFNLLVTGSKGFLDESRVGHAAFDSFVLPVFDGHYTINTLMSAKHMPRYLDGQADVDVQERVNFMRRTLFESIVGDQINKKSSQIRNPDFFDYAGFWDALQVPLELDVANILDQVRALMAEIDESPSTFDENSGLADEPEYKYKTGILVHWLEALLAAGEFWYVTENDDYLNVIVRQYNELTKAFNEIISEGGFATPFMQPMRQQPIPNVEDREAYLRRLLDVYAQIENFRQPVAGD